MKRMFKTAPVLAGLLLATVAAAQPSSAQDPKPVPPEPDRVMKYNQPWEIKRLDFLMKVCLEGIQYWYIGWEGGGTLGGPVYHVGKRGSPEIQTCINPKP